MLKTVVLMVLVTYAVASVITGGWTEWRYDVDSENVVATANFAVGELSLRLNSQYHSKLVQVHRYKTQVVAGVNYKLELTLGKTNCKKSEVNYENISQCEVQDNETSKCTVVVYKDLHGGQSLSSSSCSSASN